MSLELLNVKKFEDVSVTQLHQWIHWDNQVRTLLEVSTIRVIFEI